MISVSTLQTNTIKNNQGLYFLTAFSIFIDPLLQAPKNIAFGLMVILFLYQSMKKTNQNTPWTKWDTFLACYLLSYFIALPFTLYHSPFKALLDVAHIIIFGWIIYRTNFNKKQKFGLIFWATVGTVVGLIHGAWDHFYLGHREFWTLHAVGHVNHAAIYNAIICGMAFSALIAYWKIFSISNRLLWISMLTACLIFAVFGESRAAFGAILILVMLLCLGFSRKNKKLLLIPLVSIILLTGVAIVGHTRIVEKQQTNAAAHNVLAFRDIIWRGAFESFKQHPLFGLGKNNFHFITLQNPDQSIYKNPGHAHNLFLNVLAETGLWGACWVFGFFLIIGFTLLRYLPKKNSSAITWLCWGAASSALSVTMIIGLVNTTFHHEHANLAMLCFGLWINQYRSQQSTS